LETQDRGHKTQDRRHEAAGIGGRQYLLSVWFFLLLLFVAFSAAFAQTTNQQAYWIRLYARTKISKNTMLHFEADERRFVRPDRQLQYISHLHLHHSWGRQMEASVGMSYSRVNHLNEWRSFQEFFYRMPLGKNLIWSNRFRTEQRYLQRFNDTWRWRYRFRYRFQIDYRIAPQWLLKANDEIMYHADGFDQNRIYFAVEHRFSKLIAVEVGYLKLYQAAAGNAFFDRDILRTTAYFDF